MMNTLIRKIVVTITSALLLTSCDERRKSHYPTADAATKAGAFERGWLPVVLQPDLTDIREWHDLNSNDVRGRFTINHVVLLRMQSECKKSSEIPPIELAPEWWPRSISEGEAETGVRVVHCREFFVAIDAANRTGYFWDDHRVSHP
jgi:hypothetical protein